MARHARRLVYLVHRWTGIGGCLLMLAWIVSGIVMLYVGYPRLLPQERLGALPVLGGPDCCVPVAAALARVETPAAVRSITLTTIGGRPAYRLLDGDGRLRVVDARTAALRPPPGEAMLLAGAGAYAPGRTARLVGRTGDDRWTHAGSLDAHRPLAIVELDDPAATRLYLSTVTGEVVLDAPRAERRWNAVGAWLHWLYPLRDGSRDPVWSWTVIALSAIATGSAVTGLVAGLWRWRFRGRYKSGARTPYRGLAMRWHHLAGLVFGSALIGWAFSGLMSMNPLGVFDARGPRPDPAGWRGGLPGTHRPAVALADALARLAEAGFAVRELDWRVLAGRPYLLARDGADRTRLVVERDGGAAVVERLPEADLAEAGRRALPAAMHPPRRLDRHDAYYYARGDASMYAGSERRLPVLVLDFDDPGATRIYADPSTGDIALAVDRRQRAGRWLFNLLHSWDLPAMLEARRLREAVLILLGLGMLAVAGTGTVIGWRRLRPVRPAAAGQTKTGRSPFS